MERKYFISYYWESDEFSTLKGIDNDIFTLEKDQLDVNDIKEIENNLSSKDILIKIINIQPLPIQ